MNLGVYSGRSKSVIHN